MGIETVAGPALWPAPSRCDQERNAIAMVTRFRMTGNRSAAHLPAPTICRREWIGNPQERAASAVAWEGA